ncbi:phospholipase B [Russula aff. rugulosa BPL654]|nr:phospholipase B [Russula aff. rugulosa BPL654]
MLLRLYLATLTLTGVVYALNGSVTDYTPLVNQPCPDVTTDPLLRVFTAVNQSLNPSEESYVNTRLTAVIPNEWINWIGDGSAIGYNLSSLNNTGFPKVGIAIGGSGLRAAQYGAGVLSALDARNESAKAAGTGGLLQVTSYLSGLSGGSWLTGSLYMNDFPTIKDLVFGNGGNMSGWLLDLPLFTPEGSVSSKENQLWYDNILESVFAKAGTGVDTSITDLWSRIISYHFLNQTSRANFFTNDTAHGAGQLWSNVPSMSSWQQYLVPFPIIQADSRPAGSKLTTTLNPNSMVYEANFNPSLRMTPMEFGSWDPQLSAMVNITYAGTLLTNGQPDNSTACTTFFDQIGFIMGTSASFFNTILDVANHKIKGLDKQSTKAISYLLTRLLDRFPSPAADAAIWPNPFHNIDGKQNFQDLSSTSLELIDGGSNLEDLPLGQQFVKARGLDVVVAVDGSSIGAKNNFASGTSLLTTASRITNLLLNSHQPFPPLPGNATEFTTTGVNQRPTFFGCFPTQSPPEFPMVIYLPNSAPLDGADPVTKYTIRLFNNAHPALPRPNTSERHRGFVPKTSSADPNFGKCMQCAAIDRARYKVVPPLSRSSFCTQCFQQYCFDPNNLTSSSELPNRKFEFADPDPDELSTVWQFLSRNKVAIILGFIGLFTAIAVLCVFLIRRDRRAREARLHDGITLNSEEVLPFLRRWSLKRNRDSDSSGSESLQSLPPPEYENLWSHVPEEYR